MKKVTETITLNSGKRKEVTLKLDEQIYEALMRTGDRTLYEAYLAEEYNTLSLNRRMKDNCTSLDTMNNKIVKTIKWLMAITAFTLLVIIFMGLFFGWFKQNDVPMSETELSENGGVVVPSQAEGSEISLTSYAVPIAEYGDHGVMATADSAQVLTATVYPDNSATNSAVSWQAAWKNPSSSWASGKTLSSYLTLSYGSGATASKSCTVTCLQAFGEPVIITVTADDNPSAQATVQADYMQKVTDYALKFGTLNCVWGRSTEVTLELNEAGLPTGGLPTLTPTLSSTYTLAADYTVTYTLTAGSTDQIFVSGTGNMSNGVSVGFFKHTGDGTHAETTKFDFSTYDVKSKGLYFGLKFMVTNMGFGGESHFMTSYSDPGYAGLLSAIANAYDNNTSGSYGNWKINKTLYRLTVKLTSGGSDITKWTDIQATAYKNTSNITRVTTNSANLRF